jgi:hypothetical protein
MTPFRPAVRLALVLAALASTGCASRLPMRFGALSRDAEPVLLTSGPVHLGNDLASGQSFSTGPAIAARYCSLVVLPESASVALEVQEVRGTETLTSVLLVNGRATALPVTLERDPAGVTSNATSASPVTVVQLEEGPSEVCLVAGQLPNGDLDDFEVAGLAAYVEDIAPDAIQVRRGLVQGAPAQHPRPSVTWGERQAWPPSPPPAFPFPTPHAPASPRASRLAN